VALIARSTSETSWVDDVQTFWFEELDRAVWFEPDANVDAMVRTRFLAVHEHIVSHFDHNGAAVCADRALSTVIVLDQFPRNMFRAMPRAFATDHLALAVARSAIDRKLDQGLDKDRRLFLYLPFEHSEQLPDQDRAVELIGSLGDHDLLGYAMAHRDIIARYGRFPHRNAILGRLSTPDEIQLLQQSEDAFWVPKKQDA
jgi:uncharacterized protein (DUF924 family)